MAVDLLGISMNSAEKNTQLSGSRAEEKASLMSGVGGRRGRTGWRPQNGNRESRKTHRLQTKVRLIKTPVSADHSKKKTFFGSNGFADGVLTGRHHHHHHHANRNLKKMYVKAGGGREQ